MRVSATSPTLWVLVPATNIGVEPLGHVGFIAAIALEDLGVELALPISRHLQVLDPTRGGDQVAAVEAVAISFALGTAFSPAYADERIKLLAHDAFQYHADGSAG
jgi:hypothetical protein